MSGADDRPKSPDPRWTAWERYFERISRELWELAIFGRPAEPGELERLLEGRREAAGEPGEIDKTSSECVDGSKSIG